MAAGQDEGMDFHKAFLTIDTDHSGEITIDELQSYCRKMNYQETFVNKWLMLFDADQNGRITYDEYCDALGIPPKKDAVDKHKSQGKGKKPGKTARTVKVAKRRKEQEETKVTVETVGQQPIKEEVVQAAAVAPVASSAAPVDQEGPPPSRRARIRNQPLCSSGVMRYSRARVFQRKAIYRLAKKSASNKLARKSKGGSSVTEQKQQKPALVEKPIGGDKNGGTRQVVTRRQPRNLPTEPASGAKRRRPTRSFSQHRRRLRASIKPGSVLILLAGRHRGKRVVFLRQLQSGLLLVTGPYKINGCPLRRVCQSFVIATKTRLELGDIKLPERINDAYFRRSKKLAKKSTASEDPFARQQSVYQLTQERREDQKVVDAQMMSIIARLGRSDRKLMLGYLSSLFSLKSGQKPHEMVF